MCKVGILVHPFWMYLNGEKHLEEYKNILASNKYETLYVYLPSMCEETRRALFSIEYDRILAYYLKIEKDVIIPDDMDYFLESMSNLIINNKSYIYIINKLIIRYLKTMNISFMAGENKGLFLYAFLMDQKEIIIEYISDYYLKYMFFGDLSNCPVREELIYDFLATKTNTNVKALYYGGVETANCLSNINGIYSEIKNGEKEVTVDIFGEYVNNCVLGISRYLKMNDINVNIVKDKSLFYSKSLIKGGFHKQNRLGKYLAVFNPPVETNENTNILDNWYYDKNNVRIENESRTKRLN